MKMEKVELLEENTNKKIINTKLKRRSKSILNKYYISFSSFFIFSTLLSLITLSICLYNKYDINYI